MEPERRERLFQAAMEELTAHGYAEASLNRIIRASGLSKGSVYYHFADKADLVAEVMGAFFARVPERLGPAAPVHDAASFWARVDQLMATFDQLAVEDPTVGALGRMLYSTAEPAVLALRRRAESWVADRLAEGQAVGAVRDDLPVDLLATALVGMLMSVDRWFVDRLDRVEPQELLEISARSRSLVRGLVESTASPP